MGTPARSNSDLRYHFDFRLCSSFVWGKVFGEVLGRRSLPGPLAVGTKVETDPKDATREDRSDCTAYKRGLIKTQEDRRRDGGAEGRGEGNRLDTIFYSPSPNTDRLLTSYSLPRLRLRMFRALNMYR